LNRQNCNPSQSEVKTKPTVDVSKVKDEPRNIENESSNDHKSSSITQRLCKICNVSIVVTNYSRHIEGRVHKELVIQKELGVLLSDKNVFLCRTCNSTYNDGKSFSNHLGIHPSNTPSSTDNRGIKRSLEEDSVMTNNKKINIDLEERIAETSVSDVDNIDDRGRKRSREDVVATDSPRISPKVFKCNDCDLIYNNIKSLETHRVTHTDKYKCKTCLYQFASRRDLERHSKNPEKCSKILLNKQRCDLCSKQFSCKASLEIHKKIHTDSFECSNCHHRFSTQRNLDKHMKDLDNCKKYMEGGDTMKVSQVPKENSVVAETRKSVLKPVEQPKFNCRECDAVLTSNRSFELHVRTHEVDYSSELEEDQEDSEDLFQCEKCYKYFASEITFNNHKQSHTESEDLETKSSEVQLSEPDNTDNSLKFSSTIPDLILDTTR